MTEECAKWEQEAVRARLSARHDLRILRANAQKKQSQKQVAQQQKKLCAAMKSWTYTGKTTPSDTEIAWLIHSQIAWKGTDFDEEEFWEDLPETDPAHIISLEQKGPEEPSLLPDQTILLLHNVLNELETHGIAIKDQTFSQNWQRKNKKHRGSSRIQEILAKPVKPTPKTEAKLKTKPTPKTKIRIPTRRSALLSGFFGWIEI